MKAFSVIRMQVKPDYEEEFLALTDNPGHGIEAGLRCAHLIRTGERSYCLIGQWDNVKACAEAGSALPPDMDRLRPMLEDLGDGTGTVAIVTGEIIARMKPRAAPGEYWSG